MKKIALLFLLLFSMLVSAKTNYFIKKGGSGDGSSWDNALGEIPTALFGGSNTARPLDNVHLYIAEGDYDFNSTYAYLGNQVLIQGGFPKTVKGKDLSGYNPNRHITRIIKPANMRFVDIYSTVNTFQINQLTIKGLYFKSTGNLTVSGNIVNHEGSSAKYIQLKIEDCVFYESASGAGMIRLTQANLGKVTHWIHNNQFYGNKLGETGIFDYSSFNGDVKVLISNNLFKESRAVNGAGFYASNAGNSTSSKTHFYLIGNLFSCSSASGSTGGIHLNAAGNVRIQSNQFLGVKGKNYGGAIFANDVRGLQIENNYFIQNTTTNLGIGGGGAIAIAGNVNGGSLLTSNYIKNNYFYENSLQTTRNGGSAISMSEIAPINAAHKYDIIGNVFAYNNSKTERQASIQTRGNNIDKLNDNLFFGNANDKGTLDVYSEVRAYSSTNIHEMKNNQFQLGKAEDYQASNLGYKIAKGNDFGSSIKDLKELKSDAFTLDCHKLDLGCIQMNKKMSNTSEYSAIGISTFGNTEENWPSKNLLNNSSHQGIMIVEVNEKSLIVIRVDNPEKVLGTDAKLKGSLVYNTSKNCLAFFDGVRWDCLMSSCEASILDRLDGIRQ